METQLEYLKTREHKDRSLLQQWNLFRFSGYFNSEHNRNTNAHLQRNEQQNKLEDLESKSTLQLNQVEDQVSERQVQQVELAKAIATLSRITANSANRQQRFENNILTFNRQPLQKQIVTTKRSIENRNRNLIKQNFKKMGQENTPE